MAVLTKLEFITLFPKITASFSVAAPEIWHSNNFVAPSPSLAMFFAILVLIVFNTFSLSAKNTKSPSTYLSRAISPTEKILLLSAIVKCKLFDVIIAQGACTNSAWAHQYRLPGTFSAIGSFDLLKRAYDKAEELNIPVHVGNILSSDIFYNDKPEVWKNWARMGCLAVEMETYALYCTAASLNKKALTILTVSDSLVLKEETTAEQREKSFSQMMEIALEIA